MLGSLFVLSAALLYGSSAILIKVAYAYNATALTILSLRYGLAAAAIWTLIGLMKSRVSVSRNSLFALTIIGGVIVPIQVFGFVLALKYLPASSVSVLAYLYPFHVAWMGWIFLKEPIRRDEAVALFTIALGVLLVAGETPAFGPGLVLLVVMVATLANAVYVVAARHVLQQVSSLHAQAVLLPLTAIVFLVLALLTGELSLELPLPAFLPILGLTMFGTLLAPLLLFAGLQVVRAARAAMLGTIEPVITVILSVLLLGDRLSSIRVVGSAIIIASVTALVARRTPSGK